MEELKRKIENKKRFIKRKIYNEGSTDFRDGQIDALNMILGIINKMENKGE